MLRSMLRTALYKSTRIDARYSKPYVENWLRLKSLADFLVQWPINLVVDVGANEGQFAKKLRLLGFTGRIASFEPDPRCFASLAKARGEDRDWSIQPFALGDVEGEFSFNLAQDSQLSSLLAPVNPENVKDRVAVPVRRLDDLTEQLSSGIDAPVILLKTDTQGYDLNVLRGAKGSLGRIAGIFAEIPVIPIYRNLPTFGESIAEYADAGFDLVELLVVNRTDDGRVLEYDGLFVRRSAVHSEENDLVASHWANKFDSVALAADNP
jgi:FkbM family methyltransferase